VQDVRHEDQSHRVFDVVHLRELMNHHEPEDLHGDVGSLGLMACAVHLPMNGVHQSEQDAPLASNFVRDVKGGMGAYLYLPSLLTPSLFLIMIFISTLILGK
jgi:hypothetical protein